jgi:hypothetical protein
MVVRGIFQTTWWRLSQASPAKHRRCGAGNQARLEHVRASLQADRWRVYRFGTTGNATFRNNKILRGGLLLDSGVPRVTVVGLGGAQAFTKALKRVGDRETGDVLHALIA